MLCFFVSSRRRHTRWPRDWSSDVCSSDLRNRRGRARRWASGKDVAEAPSRRVGDAEDLASRDPPGDAISMMRPGPTISSVRQPRAWLIVAGGLALYGALVLILLAAGIWPSLPLSWWVAQAAPPILYGLLVLVCVPRVSGSRWIVATLSLWAAHVLLGVLTGAVVARYGEATVDPAVTGAFPPPPLPQILWVPLLLIPLRDVIAGGSRLRRRHKGSGRERGSGPGGRPPAPASPQQTDARAAGHAVATAGPAGAPSSERVMTEERLMADPGTRPRESHETGARQSPLGHVGPPGGRATPKEQTSDAVGARAVAEPAPAQRLLDEMLARDTSGDVVRVSFE